MRQDGERVYPRTFAELTDFSTVSWHVNENLLDIQGTYDGSGFSGYTPLCFSCGLYSGTISNVIEGTRRPYLDLSIAVGDMQIQEDACYPILSLRDMRLGGRYSIMWTDDLSAGWTEIDTVIAVTYDQVWDSADFAALVGGNGDYFNSRLSPNVFLKMKEAP